MHSSLYPGCRPPAAGAARAGADRRRPARPVRRELQPSRRRWRHAPTGGWSASTPPWPSWPTAGSGSRTLQAAETDSSTLEVTADHTLVYALRPAGAAADAPASLFTVRRELQFRFDRQELAYHQLLEPTASYVQAGPLSCAEDFTNDLRPLLAGQTAKMVAPAGTDPYAHRRRHGPVRGPGDERAAQGVRPRARGRERGAEFHFSSCGGVSFGPCAPSSPFARPPPSALSEPLRGPVVRRGRAGAAETAPHPAAQVTRPARDVADQLHQRVLGALHAVGVVAGGFPEGVA